MTLTDLLDRKLYPHHSSNWDDALFRWRILGYIEGQALDVLDLGAGPGIVSQMNFRGIAKAVYGVDIDPRVTTNPYLDEVRVGRAEALPYPNEHFDLVFADNVLEHLSDPVKVFSELWRVLRPGGLFLAKTPNKWHYMTIIARLTPHGFHQWINRKRGRQNEDTFPTCYLANSPNAVRGLAQQCGFTVEQIDLIEGRPEYLRMLWPTYVLGWIYERLVNKFDVLSPFRILLVIVLRKPQITSP